MSTRTFVVNAAGVLMLAMSFAVSAQAQTTLRYSILFQDRNSGEQVTTTLPDGTIKVEFSYRDNGRGPTLTERLVLNDDGTLAEFRVSGHSTYGAAIDESYSLQGGKGRWKSTADQGEVDLSEPAMYVPVDSSLEPLAIAVRAALRRPEGLPGLPGGLLRAHKVTERLLRDERSVALYALTGVGLTPSYVWLDATGNMALFAAIYPGSPYFIAAGWEDQASVLEQAQVEAESGLLRDLAAHTAHRYADPVLLRNVRVFDTASASLTTPRDVYLNNGRIAAIYPTGSVDQGAATIIEGAGRALLPALFDMHSHESPWNAALQIAGGITTARDLGSQNRTLAQLNAHIARGEWLGPRISAAGFIEGESPFSSRGGIVVASAAAARDAIDWYAQRGYRQVKIYNSFRPEWVAETTRHAHARGIRVSGHVPAFGNARQVVLDGYDELQHVNQLMLNFLATPDTDTRTLARFVLPGEKAKDLDLDSAPVQDFIALLKERGTVVDPTLATFEAMFTQAPGEMNPSFAMIAAHLPAGVQRSWRSAFMDVSGDKLPAYRASFAKMVEFIGRLHRAGIPLVAGTDEIAGFTLHRELELYVQAGISPGEALRIATQNGARYTGLEERTGQHRAP